MKKRLYILIKGLAVTLDIFIIFLAASMVYFNVTIPESYSVTKDENINFVSCLSLKGCENIEKTREDGELYFLNTIPVKTVELNLVDRKTVTVSGAPFGIKMITRGLMVVGLTDVCSENGRINPAKEAGIEVGDIILSINSKKLRSNEQLGLIVENSGGEELDFMISRNGEIERKKVTPIKSVGDKQYRIGIWVRDSSAGIGIMTYIDKNSGTFAGLGHPVCDIDIGDVMPLKSGEIMRTSITGCQKGRVGAPGELKGKFEGYASIGEITINSETGIYGNIKNNIFKGREVPIAYNNEIKLGKASILTTVDGDGPEEYSVVIEKLNSPQHKTQNMVVRVTDKRLLEKAGGIVQGMSGSPIIQDGRLVGAVTHVFVNDPTRGYGIFIENMMDTQNKYKSTKASA